MLTRILECGSESRQEYLDIATLKTYWESGLESIKLTPSWLRSHMGRLLRNYAKTTRAITLRSISSLTKWAIISGYG